MTAKESGIYLWVVDKKREGSSPPNAQTLACEAVPSAFKLRNGTDRQAHSTDGIAQPL